MDNVSGPFNGTADTTATLAFLVGYKVVVTRPELELGLVQRDDWAPERSTGYIIADVTR